MNTILSLIGLLFPKLHIVSVFIGLDGNQLSVSLLCILEIITYMIIFSYIVHFIKHHAYLMQISLLVGLLLPIRDKIVAEIPSISKMELKNRQNEINLKDFVPPRKKKKLNAVNG